MAARASDGLINPSAAALVQDLHCAIQNHAPPCIVQEDQQILSLLSAPTIVTLEQKLKAVATDSAHREIRAKIDSELASARQSSSLAHVAEIAAWLGLSQARILRLSRIEKFTKLHPSRAHRYLGYMAREGFIDEVITTNYDTCIENAYERSFGHELSKSGPPLHSAIIHDLQGLRQHSGRAIRIDAATGIDDTLLKIYKINGCAEHYRKEAIRAGDDGHFRIELTERELQALNNRQWADNLLRMRARNRSLFFIGFGSGEPQIRHTMLALVAEFQTDGNGKRAPLKIVIFS
ncbi:MAG: hypothetical protein GKR94_32270 [Gammaproteobacteria bacterium]|nr:hypothetical protein [Gammaproteobacteria bacterium]